MPSTSLLVCWRYWTTWFAASRNTWKVDWRQCKATISESPSSKVEGTGTPRFAFQSSKSWCNSKILCRTKLIKFVIALNVIEDFLQGEGYKFLRLVGSTLCVRYLIEICIRMVTPKAVSDRKAWMSSIVLVPTILSISSPLVLAWALLLLPSYDPLMGANTGRWHQPLCMYCTSASQAPSFDMNTRLQIRLSYLVQILTPIRFAVTSKSSSVDWYLKFKIGSSSKPIHWVVNAATEAFFRPLPALTGTGRRRPVLFSNWWLKIPLKVSFQSRFFQMVMTKPERIMQIGKKKLVLDHLIVQKMDDDEEGGGGNVQSILSFGAQALFELEQDSRDIICMLTWLIISARKWRSADTDNDIDKLIEKTEKENEEQATPKEGGLSFSFAKIWAADKDSLEEVDDDDQVDSWARTLQRITAEREKEQSKETALSGRGARRRAADVAKVRQYRLIYSIRSYSTRQKCWWRKYRGNQSQPPTCLQMALRILVLTQTPT